MGDKMYWVRREEGVASGLAYAMRLWDAVWQLQVEVEALKSEMDKLKVCGVEVSRAEAIAIARKALRDAERERAELAEKEAKVGVQYGDVSEMAEQPPAPSGLRAAAELAEAVKAWPMHYGETWREWVDECVWPPNSRDFVARIAYALDRVDRELDASGNEAEGDAAEAIKALTSELEGVKSDLHGKVLENAALRAELAALRGLEKAARTYRENLPLWVEWLEDDDWVLLPGYLNSIVAALTALDAAREVDKQ